jgi:ATP-binding cassette, subfamily F, member 3
MASVPLISARGLAKSFGGRHVLDGLDLELAAGARIGVLGPNGGGKSTLLRILAGLAHPDAGEVVRRRGLVHAFLPQEVAGDERTPLATVLAARPELADLEAELHAAERRLADPALAHDMDAMARALANQERLLAGWHELSGDRAEGEARMHLRDLGLAEAALERPTRELSGGQRKLVVLAACLARRPDVLLLDEPEAHLDMRRRDQLERLVAGFGGAVLMVSHDRHLLDECVSAIAELDRGRVRIWPGAYSAYTVARELELERQRQAYVTQQKEIARLEEAIRRFRHWAHIRVNERMIKQARVKQMQIDKMDKVERPVLERRKMALALRSGVRGGQRVLALEGVDVASCSTSSSSSCAASASASSGPTARARPFSRACSPASWSRAVGAAGPATGSRSAISPRPPPAWTRTRPSSTRCAPGARSPRTTRCGG